MRRHRIAWKSVFPPHTRSHREWSRCPRGWLEKQVAELNCRWAGMIVHWLEEEAETDVLAESLLTSTNRLASIGTCDSMVAVKEVS